MNAFEYIAIIICIMLALAAVAFVAFIVGTVRAYVFGDIKRYGGIKNIFKTYFWGFLILGWIVIVCYAAIFWGFISSIDFIKEMFKGLDDIWLDTIFIWYAIFLFCAVPGGVFFFFKKQIARMNSVFGSGDNGVPYYLRYSKFIDENRTKLGLFVRRSQGSYNVELANKYCALKIDLLLSNTEYATISITDKLSGEEEIYKCNTKYANTMFRYFTRVCEIFNYETKAPEVKIHSYDDYKVLKQKTIKHDFLYLDINSASEAELTAIPGVTIAKAKHLSKVRKEQKVFLTMNQFYDAAGLKEEFIAQIESKGNKILLNGLPDYRKFIE